MKKSGFTMIELIFVIVIIGILAAVAVPKLAATRTDAKVAALSQEIQSAISEIPAYVTAQGGNVYDENMSQESQVINQLVSQGKAKEEKLTENNNTTGYKVTIHADSDDDDCIELETNKTALRVIYGSATGTVCTALQNRIAEANYTIVGTGVKF